jgi:hypothetical protein
MKYLLVFLPFLTFAQDEDLKQRILKLEMRQIESDLKMERFQKEYRNGTWVLIAGAATTIVNTVIWSRQNHDDAFSLDPGKRGGMGFAIGGGLITLGTAMQVRAHRHLRTRKYKII